VRAPEGRIYTAELREIQAVGRPYRYLEGRAVPYDTFATIAWFREAHEPGSFAQSTTGGTGLHLPLLLFHDNRSWPAGHAESWDSQPDALHGVWRLNDTPDAQLAAQLAEAGDLTGMSIGFQPLRSKWDYVSDWDPDLGPDHMDSVYRLESRLLEVSLTPTPAFADAQVSKVYTEESRDAHIQQRAAHFAGVSHDADGYRRWVAEHRR
jgi:HK97 family phage prohead protease